MYIIYNMSSQNQDISIIFLFSIYFIYSLFAVPDIKLINTSVNKVYNFNNLKHKNFIFFQCISVKGLLRHFIKFIN